MCTSDLDPWTVYLVHDSPLVSPLANEPVVVRNAPVAGRSWTDPAVTWFNDPTRWDVAVAADGPEDWARVDLVGDRLDGEGAVVLDEFEAGPLRPLPEVAVSDIRDERDRLSFSVDRTGVPVVVKVSYFPNWSVAGARGPYRVTPNWMIVIPDQDTVTLTYGATNVEYLAWILTILGVLALFILWRRPFTVDPPAHLDRPDALDPGKSPRNREEFVRLDVVDAATEEVAES